MLIRLYYVVEIITGVKSFTAQAPCCEIIVDVFFKRKRSARRKFEENEESL
jgi:hypothetical protein